MNAGRLAMIGVTSFLFQEFVVKDDVDLIKSYVSLPVESSYIHIPGKRALKREEAEYATKALVMTFPLAESPSFVTIAPM